MNKDKKEVALMLASTQTLSKLQRLQRLALYADEEELELILVLLRSGIRTAEGYAKIATAARNGAFLSVKLSENPTTETFFTLTPTDNFLKENTK